MTQETEVLAVFDALFAAACEARDADGIVEIFVGDADLLWWGSNQEEQHVGPEGLRTFAERIVLFEGTLRFTWHERRTRIDGNVAWVSALGNVEVETPDSRQTGPYRVTGIFLHREGRWMWHTFHGSSPEIE